MKKYFGEIWLRPNLLTKNVDNYHTAFATPLTVT
jgi:hypothetical protein